MGFAPIILAFSGFIFLWAIVNYNTFKKIERRMAACYLGLIELYTQKKQAANTLKSYLAQEGLCSEKIENILSGFEEEPQSDAVLLADKNLSQWLQGCLQRAYANDELVKGDDFQNLKDQLAKIQGQVMQYKRQLKSAINDYNTLRQNLPSSLIASVFGFRPIDVQIA
jgi:LemA protein